MSHSDANIERHLERHRIIVSVATSVGLHLLFLLLAVVTVSMGGFLPPGPAQASRPNEVVIYLPELVPVPSPEAQRDAPAPPRYVRTSEANRSDTAPAATPFESDRNTLAASDGTAAGPQPLPSVDGMKDLPFVELENREHVDGREANEAAAAESRMRPNAAPLAPKPMPAPSLAMAAPALPSPLLPVEEVAPRSMDQDGRMAPEPRASELTEKSFSDRDDALETPAVAREERRVEGGETPMKQVREAPEERTLEDASETAPAPQAMPAEAQSAAQTAAGNPGFRPHTRATEIRGTISNRGRASFDAAETPLGRYKARVSGEIEKLWHRFRQEKAEFIVYGSIQLQFEVDRHGHPRNLKIIRNDANAIMLDFTLSAILEADIPPMPEEILDILEDEKLNVTYDVIIY